MTRVEKTILIALCRTVLASWAAGKWVLQFEDKHIIETAVRELDK